MTPDERRRRVDFERSDRVTLVFRAKTWVKRVDGRLVTVVPPGQELFEVEVRP